MSVRFTQCCPTCGRRIQIRATLLGRTVACQHCHAEFVAEMESEGSFAADRINTDRAASNHSDPLMARVDALLSQTVDHPGIDQSTIR